MFDCYYSENSYTFPPETNVFTYKSAQAIEPGRNRAVLMVTRVLEGCQRRA